MSRPLRPLHLPTPGVTADKRRRRRPPSRVALFGTGLLLLGCGVALLYGLLLLPDRLDTLLLVSKAIATVIQGLGLLLLGLLQLTALLGLVLLALLGLLLMVGGCRRLIQALTQRPSAPVAGTLGSTVNLRPLKAVDSPGRNRNRRPRR